MKILDMCPCCNIGQLYLFIDYSGLDEVRYLGWCVPWSDNPCKYRGDEIPETFL
jgi:hypothetical protein